MGTPQVVMFEEEQQQIQAICDRLQRDSNSIAILVINKDGQEIARAGNTEHLEQRLLDGVLGENGHAEMPGGRSRQLRLAGSGKAGNEDQEGSIEGVQWWTPVDRVIFRA